MTEAAIAIKERVDALSADDQCDLIDLVLIHQFDEEENGPGEFVPREKFTNADEPISEQVQSVMKQIATLSFDECEQLLEYANHVLAESHEPDEAFLAELDR